MKKILFFLILFFLTVVGSGQAGVPGFMKARMGTLTGQFYVVQEQPLKNALVSFFNKSDGQPPIIGSARRVPDMVSRTDESGSFSVKLLPGEYYMGALVREVKDGPGPPREGESYFFAMKGAGELRLFEVKSKQVTTVGIIRGTTPDKLTEYKQYVVMKGRVIDEKGDPFKGALVTVKDKLNAPRPKFVGERVGADGKYEIRLPPGRYYLMARESLRRGRPRAGSFVGSYGKTGPSNGGALAGAGSGARGEKQVATEAVAIETKEGEVYDNLDIIMFAIPDPEETRIKYEKEARKRQDPEGKIP